MTDWIDRRVDKLSDEQKQRNLQNARELLHASWIEARAPQFCENLNAHIEELAKELNEKLGASIGRVAATTHAAGFTVESFDKPTTIRVVGKSNIRGQQIEVAITRKGLRRSPLDGNSQTFLFRIDDNSNLFVQARDQSGPRFYEAAELASALLEGAFTADLIPTR